MRLDEPALEEYTDQFDDEAFRHECIDGIGADSDIYSRWLAGELVDSAVAAPWGQWVRDQLARGAAKCESCGSDVVMVTVRVPDHAEHKNWYEVYPGADVYSIEFIPHTAERCQDARQAMPDR